MVILLVSCTLLTDPNNGTITCSLGDDNITSYEETCSFTCNTGYELTGSSERTCQSDGSWSGSPVSCIIMECPSSSLPMNSIWLSLVVLHINQCVNCSVKKALMVLETHHMCVMC